jgi:hypothetical protein
MSCPVSASIIYSFTYLCSSRFPSVFRDVSYGSPQIAPTPGSTSRQSSKHQSHPPSHTGLLELITHYPNVYNYLFPEQLLPQPEIALKEDQDQHPEAISKAFNPFEDGGEYESIPQLPMLPLPTFDPTRRRSRSRSSSTSASARSRRRHSVSFVVDVPDEHEAEFATLPGTQYPNSREPSCVLLNRRKSRYTIEEEKIVRATGKKRLRWTRNIFIPFFVLLNVSCTVVQWVFPKFWYICKLSLSSNKCFRSLIAPQSCRLFF